MVKGAAVSFATVMIKAVEQKFSLGERHAATRDATFGGLAVEA